MNYKNIFEPDDEAPEIPASEYFKKHDYYKCEKVADPLREKYKNLNKKMNSIIEIIESDDFKSLDLNIKENEEFVKNIKNKILSIIDELKELKNTLDNTKDITIEQKKINNEDIEKNRRNVYNENYKIYKQIKENNEEIPEIFKYIFSIYEINESKTYNNNYEKLNDFIKLYNDNYDFTQDIEKDFFNVFIYEENKF